MLNLEHLSEEQWSLLVELLEREMSELPVEIRHTRNNDMREALHQRMKVVQELLDRVHEPTAV